MNSSEVNAEQVSHAGFGGARPSALIRVVALIYLMVVTFPGEYRAFQFGLDSAWMWAINELPRTHVLFGRDVVFTSGPLGFLLYPLNTGGHLFIANAFRVAVQVAFGALLFRLFFRQIEPIAAVAFAVAYTLAVALGMPFEFHLLMVFVLFVHQVGLAKSRWGPLGYGVAGAAASCMLFMKLTLGIAALATLTVCAAIEWKRTRSFVGGLGRNLPPAVSTLLAFLTLAAVFLRTPANTLRWLRLSLAMVGGFNAGMSRAGPESALTFGLITLAAYGALVLWMLRGKRQGISWLVLASPAVIIAFKQGYVRQEDFHTVAFFCVVLAAASLLLLIGPSWRFGGAVVGSVFLLSVPFLQQYVRCETCESPARVFTGAAGIGNMRSLATLSAVQRRLDRETKFRLSGLKLPADYLSLIQKDPGSFDVVPHELGWLVANDLPWSPSPVIQLYSAYTKTLDDETAAHFAGEDAPKYLLADMRDIDGRYPLWSAPATWRVILENYRVVAEDLSPERGADLETFRPQRQPFSLVLRPVLLKHREEPSKVTMSLIGSSRVRRGEWIDVPASGGLLFATLQSPEPIGAALASLFLRTPPITVQVEFADRTRSTYRFIYSNADNGLLISHLPADQHELAALFDHRVFTTVRRIRITGPGADFLEPSFRIAWLSSNYRVDFDSSIPRGRADQRVWSVEDE